MRLPSIFFVLGISVAAVAQPSSTGCVALQVPQLAGPNMFTTDQEEQLGEIVAEQADRVFGVMDDDTLTGHMQQIVDRLTAGLPPIGMKVQVFLSNEPVLNAWSIPGRIYVTRKMIAFTASEDELAGLLAHELGHIITRQSGVEFTEHFRQVLGISQVNDRQDLFNRYQEYVETLTRNPRRLHINPGDQQRDQLLADRTAMLMLSRAGYSPAAFVEHFDRLAETKGKRGSWLTELLSTTAPDQKRLRELLKESETTANNCAAPRAADNGFKAWQAHVLAYSGSGHRERLHSVLLRTRLNPPLRGDIRHLRFSPDGKYVLAQDDASIWILSRQPFKWLFRIDAPHAFHAQFTPDSQHVVFNTPADRVERWSIAEQQRESVNELVIRKACEVRQLSPDGSVLACLYLTPQSSGAIYGVALFDVASGEMKFDKPNFHSLTFGEAWQLYFTLFLYRAARGSELPMPEFVHASFSPDSNYFVAGAAASVLALKLPAMTPVNLEGHAKSLLEAGAFAFLGNDRIAAYNAENPNKSSIFSFPAGQVEKQILMSNRLSGVTKGDFLIASCPCVVAASGNRETVQTNYHFIVLDIAQGKYRMSGKTGGFDVYGDVYVSDRLDGTIGLYDVGTLKPFALAELPLGPLASARAFDVSADGQFLAVSENSRAAIWNLKTGERIVHSNAFRGGYFGPDNSLWVDVPEFQGQPRRVVRITLPAPTVSSSIELGKDALKSAAAQQRGKYLVVQRWGEQGKGNSLELRDVTTGKSLWTRPFKAAVPSVSINDERVALVFNAVAAKREAREDTTLENVLSQSNKEERTNWAVEILDANTGQPQTSLIVTAASNAEITFAGDRLLVSENNRITSNLSPQRAKSEQFLETHRSCTAAVN